MTKVKISAFQYAQEYMSNFGEDDWVFNGPLCDAMQADTFGEAMEHIWNCSMMVLEQEVPEGFDAPTLPEDYEYISWDKDVLLLDYIETYLLSYKTKTRPDGFREQHPWVAEVEHHYDSIDQETIDNAYKVKEVA